MAEIQETHEIACGECGQMIQVIDGVEQPHDCPEIEEADPRA